METLTRSEMEADNALFAAGGTRAVELGGERFRAVYLPAFPDPYAPAFCLPFAVGGRRLILDADRVPDGAALSAALAPPGVEASGGVPSRLPPELLGAWLESRMEKLIEAAEAALGREISLDLPEPGSRPFGGAPCETLHVRLDREDGGLALRARLFFLREDRAALYGWLASPAAAAVIPPAGPFADDGALPVRLFFCLGAMRLRIEDFRGLGPGDILIPDGEPIREGRARITTGGGRPASCRAVRKVGTLFVEERMTMEAGIQETPAAARAWEELEVEIAFDLGERTLSLGEVRALRPGMVLPLPSNPEGKVRLRVNGKIVGAGSLVKVDGQVGVRILTLPGEPSVPERAAASAGAP